MGRLQGLRAAIPSRGPESQGRPDEAAWRRLRGRNPIRPFQGEKEDSWRIDRQRPQGGRPMTLPTGGRIRSPRPEEEGQPLFKALAVRAIGFQRGRGERPHTSTFLPRPLSSVPWRAVISLEVVFRLVEGVLQFADGL